MKILAAVGLLAGGLWFVPRDLLVIGVLWVVGQFSPSLAATLLLGALILIEMVEDRSVNGCKLL